MFNTKKIPKKLEDIEQRLVAQNHAKSYTSMGTASDTAEQRDYHLDALDGSLDGSALRARKPSPDWTMLSEKRHEARAGFSGNSGKIEGQ